MIDAVERNLVAYCHAYNLKYRTKIGSLVQINLYYIQKWYL